MALVWCEDSILSMLHRESIRMQIPFLRGFLLSRDVHHQPHRCRVVVAISLAMLLSVVGIGGGAGGDILRIPSASGQDTTLQSSPGLLDADQSGSGSSIPREIVTSTKTAATTGSAVEVPAELTELLKKGGVPRSIRELQLLEEQHRRVSQAAIPSTVSVQIGAAQGCGVVITGTGYVLTAAHVAMRPGKTAVITFSDGRKVMAKTLGMNRGVDAGLIRINAGQNGDRPWPHATLGSSEDLVPGMWCVATGHPGGYDPDRGVVTRVGRILIVRPDKLVTDCALIGGDSGGPLFDISGRLIGVHSRIGNDVSDNLHVPVDHYDFAWSRMADGVAWGFLPGFRPVLGVQGNKAEESARVVSVKEGSPADVAGLRADDIVEQFGEKQVTDFESLKAAVADTMPGERVPVWIKRGTSRLRLVVEIGRAD
ncbi:S1C family serine protease [Stieleria varia]|uniref:Putative serine protease HhoA n=1 Tax=Stieleria varia TaxID=2528005 RepID=A0A5C5ZX75_9BACT|nr:trypsin-like peptidase domain-containing protein [Stieleria varia]TWT91578.1 putative serine protease HhoA precursor [Stieleria varia]